MLGNLNFNLMFILNDIIENRFLYINIPSLVAGMKRSYTLTIPDPSALYEEMNANSSVRPFHQKVFLLSGRK